MSRLVDRVTVNPERNDCFLLIGNGVFSNGWEPIEKITKHIRDNLPHSGFDLTSLGSDWLPIFSATYRIARASLLRNFHKDDYTQSDIEDLIERFELRKQIYSRYKQHSLDFRETTLNFIKCELASFNHVHGCTTNWFQPQEIEDLAQDWICLHANPNRNALLLPSESIHEFIIESILLNSYWETFRSSWPTMTQDFLEALHAYDDRGRIESAFSYNACMMQKTTTVFSKASKKLVISGLAFHEYDSELLAWLREFAGNFTGEVVLVYPHQDLCPDCPKRTPLRIILGVFPNRVQECKVRLNDELSRFSFHAITS